MVSAQLIETVKDDFITYYKFIQIPPTLFFNSKFQSSLRLLFKQQPSSDLCGMYVSRSLITTFFVGLLLENWLVRMLRMFVCVFLFLFFFIFADFVHGEHTLIILKYYNIYLNHYHLDTHLNYDATTRWLLTPIILF